jgi:RNA polymerase sigma factor (sigma-70 family)
MSISGNLAVASPTDDSELVAQVRAGDDAAFEELYRRYRQRITGYVRRMVGDEARAEDVTQEAFISALRRLRATDSEIAFKPWIYEIARNASIDLYRRTSRAEELPIDEEELLHPADRGRLVGSNGPDSMAIAHERLDHLRGAFDELSDLHARLLVMRELEGMSYREIGERMHLSRSSVESALFRARRRLEREYEELSEGRRCESMGAVIGRLAEGMHSASDELSLSRHARRCSACRRRARELGVEPLSRRSRVPSRAAVLLPLPWLVRRSGQDAVGAGMSGGFGSASHIGAVIAERAATLLAAAAIAGAGGAAIAGGAFHDSHADRPAAVRTQAAEVRTQHSVSPRETKPAGRGAAAPASGGRDGGRTGARRERGGRRDGAARRDGAPVSGAPGVKLPSVPSLPAVKAPAAPQPPAAEVPKLPPVSVPQGAPPVAAPPAPAPPPQAAPPKLSVPDPGGAVGGAVEEALGALP